MNKQLDRFSFFKKLNDFAIKNDSSFVNNLFNPFEIIIAQLFMEGFKYKTSSFYSKKTYFFSFNKIKKFFSRYKDTLKFKSIKKYDFSLSKVIFFPTEITHVKQMKPIWEKLTKDKINFKIITHKKKIYNNLSNNFEIIFITRQSSFIALFNYFQIYLKSKKILENCNEFDNTRVFENVIKHQLFDLINLFYSLNKIVVSLKNTVVFIGNDSTMEGRLLNTISQNNNLTTASIMHGSVTGEPMDIHHKVDKFFVFGDVPKNDLISKGVDPKKLIVSGSPYIDDVLCLKNDNSLKILKQLKINKHKPYFLVLHSGPGYSTSHEHYFITLKNIFKIASNNKNWQFVFKLHRKDSINNFIELKMKYDLDNITIVEDSDERYSDVIFDWLKGPDAVLTGNSTVAIESMLMKVPVITMDFCEEYKFNDFIDKEMTFHSKNNEELYANLILMSQKKNNDKIIFANKYALNFYQKKQEGSSNFIIDNLGLK